MPVTLTVFLANYLIFVDILAAAIVIAGLLYRRPRFLAFRWAVTAAVLLVVSYVFALVGGLLYYDPRPFAIGHFQPLIAHAADNGFPSDHALLAAALVALAALVDLPLALPFTLLAIVIDWARVGCWPPPCHRRCGQFGFRGPCYAHRASAAAPHRSAARSASARLGLWSAHTS